MIVTVFFSITKAREVFLNRTLFAQVFVFIHGMTHVVEILDLSENLVEGSFEEQGGDGYVNF